MAEIAQYQGAIFTLCLTRLQSNKKVAASLVGAWSTYVARYGAAALKQQLEGIQPGLCNMILRGVWSEHLGYVHGPILRKTAAVSTAQLLSETDMISDAASFGPLLQALLLMLLADSGLSSAPAELNVEELPGVEEGEETSYAAAYVSLHFASNNEVDLYAEHSAAGFLKASVARLLASHGAALQAIIATIMAALPADKQAGVQALL
jgi:hypothetical protein